MASTAANKFYKSYKTRHVNHLIFLNILGKEIDNLERKIMAARNSRELDKATIELQTLMINACYKSFKIKKQLLITKPNWWAEQLEIHKKKVRALRRRAQWVVENETQARDPKGSLQEAARNILDQIFLSPAILTNYNVTTSTQPPDLHSPQRNLGGNRTSSVSQSPGKGGKDQRLASSYRPISLLPTIGKVLEKLMTQRLTYHLESTNSLNDRQHGFREGKSVDTAINELLSKIHAARRDGKHVFVLSIGIKGAFDNLQHRAILKSLDASTCPININILYQSFLQNRKVKLRTPQGRARNDQKQGCPQGSCSDPILWNLVANEILNQVWPDNVHIQVFADDIVLVIEADTKKGLVKDTQNAITQFSSWCSENELTISRDKTNYILFSKMAKIPKIT
ncbi:Putative protein in type-1 retrotransposable element R1DM [Araneus ventricosus]|uniref:Reverse transcriptase domain-containing protein n=1 Tax=Araneus ventricosus TaxID=182803 RepID=A0A4Y2SRM2_ARAVE|nr:Putative protein in type-1 retrotransposable element R1DM [Araneus ventricosus]